MTINSLANIDHRDHSEGFSLVEFITVSFIVLVLIWFALDRLYSLQAVAERLAFEQNFTRLRTAALQQYTKLMTQDTPVDFGAIQGTNPMEWDIHPPYNYLGALEDPDPRKLPGQRWWYDLSRGLLVYKIKYPGEFTSALNDPPRIHLKVHLAYADKDHDGEFSSISDLVTGLTISAAEPYRWNTYPAIQ